MKRTLKLDREALSELSTGELENVLGAAAGIHTQVTCPELNRCISLLISCFYC